MMFWKLGNFTSSNSFLRKKNSPHIQFFLSFFLWIFVLCLHSYTGISLPTFIIAECVLIYLDPESTRGIVGWASKTFSTAAFFLYEQVLNFLRLIDLFFPLHVSLFFFIHIHVLACLVCLLTICYIYILWWLFNRYTRMMLLDSK